MIGYLQLEAPTLLLNEVTDGVVQARRRGRINDEQADEILSSSDGLGIALKPVSGQQMFPLAIRFDRSAYDAAYLGLAEVTEQPLVTGDSRMYKAVHAHLDRVQWIGDYQKGETH